jgi:hypothetical protein
MLTVQQNLRDRPREPGQASLEHLMVDHRGRLSNGIEREPELAAGGVGVRGAPCAYAW